MSETLADIVREMRNRTDLDGRDMVDNFSLNAELGEYGGYDALKLIRAYADRIEAAYKRETEYPLGQSAFADQLKGKTIADLIADLRQIAKYHYAESERNGGCYGAGLNDHMTAQFARVMAERFDAAYKRENDAIERTVRDAVVAYDFDYPMAPNEDCERELVARAKTANDWLVAHGYDKEGLTHMEGGAE